MSLEGGRTLSWERSFNSEFEVKPNRSFWNKLVDFVAGAPDYRSLVRPYSIATDSRGRVIVTDPGAGGVHIFDFAEHKYKFLERQGKSKDAMLAPQCVAVDAHDNIYVTDSNAGVIFVFDAGGKFLHALGSLKGGEGYFKRPTGIAVDSAAQKIYVTDTLRDQIFVLDMEGHVLQTIGKTGQAEGEFNLPTELRLDGPNLIVVDAMNFRVQVFDRSGAFQYSVGQIGDSPGAMFRPKGASCRLGRRHLSCGWFVGHGAGLQPPGPVALLLRFARAPTPENSNCRQGCTLIVGTRFSWWIRSIAASRYFNILA